jgi:hypothetical protein
MYAETSQGVGGCASIGNYRFCAFTEFLLIATMQGPLTW